MGTRSVAPRRTERGPQPPGAETQFWDVITMSYRHKGHTVRITLTERLPGTVRTARGSAPADVGDCGAGHAPPVTGAVAVP